MALIARSADTKQLVRRRGWRRWMRIVVLGPLEVRTDDGPPVAIPGAKERLVPAVLTAEAPGVVRFDRVPELLRDRREISAASERFSPGERAVT